MADILDTSYEQPGNISENSTLDQCFSFVDEYVEVLYDKGIGRIKGIADEGDDRVTRLMKNYRQDQYVVEGERIFDKVLHPNFGLYISTALNTFAKSISEDVVDGHVSLSLKVIAGNNYDTRPYFQNAFESVMKDHSSSVGEEYLEEVFNKYVDSINASFVHMCELVNDEEPFERLDDIVKLVEKQTVDSHYRSVRSLESVYFVYLYCALLATQIKLLPVNHEEEGFDVIEG